MEIDIKLEGIEEALKTYSHEVVLKAATRTLNKVAAQTLTQIKRYISSRYNIKAGRISKLVYIGNRATFGDLRVGITGLAAGIALAYFSPKQAGKVYFRIAKGERGIRSKKGFSGRPGDVTVEVKKGSRKKVSPVGSFRPFVAQMPSSHIGVFVRTGKKMASNRKKDAIEQLFGPGVAGLMQTRHMRHEIEEKFIPAKLKEVFERELQWYGGKK